MKNKFWKTVLWWTVGGDAVASVIWFFVVWVSRDYFSRFSVMWNIFSYLVFMGLTTLGMVGIIMFALYND